ncbi:MAG TPA: PadR family transcriptional regulator [Steroidobacter sp.]|uniref:PadR family transcriptional regulator n=1 Tax=Steroidobacter sp. TaxID=1978227 RepID=UPI002ED9E08E
MFHQVFGGFLHDHLHHHHCGGPRHGWGRGGHRGMFGGGGPMGGRGGFGRGGGGRMFGPGDLRLLLLSLIEEKQRHGYELIKELEQKFGGAYAPSPGSVYPTLTLLEELGHVRSAATEGSKRLFEITDEGRRYLREHEAMLASIRKRMQMAARANEMPPQDVFYAMQTLEAALMFHRGGWSEEETERVRRIIETAAEEISRGPHDV